MKSTFTTGLHALTLLVLFPLLAGPLSAQDAEVLTDFREDQFRSQFIQELEVFKGRIYTANRLIGPQTEGRFSLVDPEAGTLVPLQEDDEYLGGQGKVGYLSSFQQLDGKLFAQVSENGSGTELYRIEGQRATQLTDLIGRPLTELIFHNGRYYFLVSGRSAGVPAEGDPRTKYIELWQTDGSREGTSLVEELPIVHASGYWNNMPSLTAGEASLLVSGYPIGDTNSGFLYYYLYRPGSGLVPVALPAGSTYTAPALRATNVDNPRISFFSGGFYLAGEGQAEEHENYQVFRIDVATAELRVIPGLLSAGNNQSLGEDVTYAIVGDSLYLHVAALYQGYRLHAASADAPESFREVASSVTSAAEVGLTVKEDTLYFGGSTAAAAHAVMRYVPSSGRLRALFSRPENALQADLYVGEDVIYAVSQAGDRSVLRYRPSREKLNVFGNFYPHGSAARLYKNSLVYIGYTAVGIFEIAEREPYLLERDSEAPRAIVGMLPATPLGVAVANTETGTADILFGGFDSGQGFQQYLLDPASDSIRRLTHVPPSQGGSPLSYLNTMGGTEVFSLYSYGDQGFRLYVLSGDSLKVVIDQATGEPLTVDYGFGLMNSVMVDNQINRAEIYRYRFDGDRASRETLLTLPGYYNRVSHTTNDLLRLTREVGDKLEVTIIKPDGTLAYTFTQAYEKMILALDTMGYYLLDYPPGAEPKLEYYAADGTSSVSFTYPAGVTPDPATDPILLGERLLFLPHNRTPGQEFYVADPATGKIGLVRDINPGPNGSKPTSRIRIGDRLYFAANDGVHGTELWRTDGTPAGTYLVADINPGTATSQPTNFYPGDSLLYFSATAEAGAEVYGMNLETGEVGLISDINPGPGGSYPVRIIETSSGVYVVASPAAGKAHQLFRLQPRILSPVDLVAIPSGKLELYPNPATGATTVRAEPGEKLVRVQLYDGSGRLLRDAQTLAERYTLPLEQLVPGRYVTVVHYASGARRAASLIVVR